MQGFGIRLPKGEDKFGKGEDVSAIREGENKIRDGVLKKGGLKQFISPTLEEENKIVEEAFPVFSSTIHGVRGDSRVAGVLPPTKL